MALAPWGVLAAGKIRTDAEEQRRKESGEKGRQTFLLDWERTPDQRKVCAALEKVAEEIGAKSISAGKSHSSAPHGTLTKFPATSGDRLRHAEDPIRLPHNRRP